MEHTVMDMKVVHVEPTKDRLVFLRSLSRVLLKTFDVKYPTSKLDETEESKKEQDSGYYIL